MTSDPKPESAPTACGHAVHPRAKPVPGADGQIYCCVFCALLARDRALTTDYAKGRP